jgi:hypothetical protein
MDPAMTARIDQIRAADAARCRSVSGPVVEHGPPVARCGRPPGHRGKHESPTGETW